MKKVLCFMLSVVIILSFSPNVWAKDDNICLDGEWDFKFFSSRDSVPQNVSEINFDDKIAVPAAMELEGYGYPAYFYEQQTGWGMPDSDGINSAGVYRISFKFDASGYIVFESVKDKIIVYLNGEKIGESRNGAAGSEFAINGMGNNELICVVERDKTGINKEDDFALSGIMGHVYVTKELPYGRLASVKTEVGENSLKIDGKEVVLKGVRYTPTHPLAGDVLTQEQIKNDIKLIKEYGFNAVWVSAAPKEFYEEAQKAGLYVIDEANVNLESANRDEAAKERVRQMIKAHGEYSSVIMWSAGFGTGDSKALVDEIKKLDSRPVAQEVNFAPLFKVFGNTGGMKEWTEALGNGNVGGFVSEFADKELYFTRNVYLFETKDLVTGEILEIDGEIKNYRGTDMLGKAGYIRNAEKMDKFTVKTYVSNTDKDRVIFESNDGSVRLETIDYGIRLTAKGYSIQTDGGEGEIAAVYADGEIQLFARGKFRGNIKCDITLTDGYEVGRGDGNVGIEYVKIYNDALTLDELLENSDEKLVSSVEFKSVKIKEDKSYDFLAYGGDFGESLNSYYKCLTGLFTSLRQPHPEAVAFGEILTGIAKNEDDFEDLELYAYDMVMPKIGVDSAVFESEWVSISVAFDGSITSIKADDKERLSSPMYPSVLREYTLSEMEAGAWQEEGWKAVGHRVEGNTLYIELSSTVTDARIVLAYSMADFGTMMVSVQSSFSALSEKPTFLGFKGAAKYDTVMWKGKSEGSTYPDRRYGEKLSLFMKPISEMSDNYAVPQENGNRSGKFIMLGNEEEYIAFSPACNVDELEFAVHDYPDEAIYEADHDEDLEREDNSYFRVGGYIKGVSGSRDYELSENEYGYSFYIVCEKSGWSPYVEFKNVSIDGEKYKAFNKDTYRYVYCTNTYPMVEADGEKIEIVENKAVFGDYVIYFAPGSSYLSDMKHVYQEGEISRDAYFDKSTLSLKGRDFWSASVLYDKGMALKSGAKLKYDVSGMNDHVFSSVVGKQDIDWRSMGQGGFNRGIFDASCTVKIYLDGVEVQKIENISMRSGNTDVNLDVSGAKEMIIEVLGDGNNFGFEDAVIANAVFIPKGPVVVNFEKNNNKAEITVLNTDKKQVDVVLTVSGNGIVKTEAARIMQGTYRTLTIEDVDEEDYVKAYITGLGEMVCE